MSKFTHNCYLFVSKGDEEFTLSLTNIYQLIYLDNVRRTTGTTYIYYPLG